jgi:hypothetical protein
MPPHRRPLWHPTETIEQRIQHASPFHAVSPLLTLSVLFEKAEEEKNRTERRDGKLKRRRVSATDGQGTSPLNPHDDAEEEGEKQTSISVAQNCRTSSVKYNTSILNHYCTEIGTGYINLPEEIEEKKDSHGTNDRKRRRKGKQKQEDILPESSRIRAEVRDTYHTIQKIAESQLWANK